MGVDEQDVPFLAGQAPGLDAPAGTPPLPGAAEGEGAGVARAFQRAEYAGALRGLPEQFAAARPVAGAPGKEQTLSAEEPDHGAGGTRTLEGVEQQLDAFPDLGVGVEGDAASRIVDEPHRQGDPQLPAPRPVHDAAAQPGAQQMEFGPAHRALEAEKQPVVEVAGAVEAVFVEDQGVRQGAQFQQPMPVGAVARQPGDFEAEHDAGAPGPCRTPAGQTATASRRSRS